MAPDNSTLFGRIITAPLRYLWRLAGGTARPTAPPPPRRTRPGTAAKGKHPALAPSAVGRYPGDFQGTVAASYSPALDGRPDPGEIVWTWVPFEEDHTNGKDRPVLLVGRDGRWLLGLMLTSKDHNNGRDAADYVDIGAGPWDPQWRASEVKLDRIIRVDPDGVRREGAVLDSATFRMVAARLRRR
ncbi:type II toxin-antitoxin system PemK/MazF family toxin [Arthrobacter silvisoli]|uniref:type II toxin-antitoxin system PemK/MazF family toxin n=1 Tax=Arthrobacter silvisoli TaxID=2291022 RepID=UPI000E2113EE|nr:type II toxin-antitoxin system PemK/MazF family toxin [Arthrobacter silvisoli]